MLFLTVLHTQQGGKTLLKDWTEFERMKEYAVIKCLTLPQHLVAFA